MIIATIAITAIITTMAITASSVFTATVVIIDEVQLFWLK